MAVENRLTTEQLAALNPGDTVTIESGQDFSRPRYAAATVIRVGATHVDVCCDGAKGGKYVERYRLRDGLRDGGGRAELVSSDTDHPANPEQLRRRTQRIDAAYRNWSHRRADAAALRELQDAISDYMAETLTS